MLNLYKRIGIFVDNSPQKRQPGKLTKNKALRRYDHETIHTNNQSNDLCSITIHQLSSIPRYGCGASKTHRQER
jgi:hypothetical protein